MTQELFRGTTDTDGTGFTYESLYEGAVVEFEAIQNRAKLLVEDLSNRSELCINGFEYSREKRAYTLKQSSGYAQLRLHRTSKETHITDSQVELYTRHFLVACNNATGLTDPLPIFVRGIPDHIHVERYVLDLDDEGQAVGLTLETFMNSTVIKRQFSFRNESVADLHALDIPDLEEVFYDVNIALGQFECDQEVRIPTPVTPQSSLLR